MKRLLTNAIIVCFAAMMFLSGIPIDFPRKANVLDVVKPAIIAAGLWQQWQMFSPLPARRDTAFEARVRFSDGTTTTWWLPRVERMSPLERAVHERYRKYEHNALGDSPALQADAARFVARAAAGAGRRPAAVTIVEWGRVTDPPKVRAKHLERGVILDYTVTAEDLR
jgi:hypothetical protein